MTVYKYFIKVALKNKGVILSYTILFFILSVINGSTNTQRETNFTESKLDIGIIDNSNSQLSRGLVNYLEKNNNIISTKSDEKYIKEQIFLQIADGVIVIPENFEDKVINKEKAVEIYKDDRKIETYQIQNQINKFILFANATYEDGKFKLWNVNDALDEKVDVNLVISDNNINQRINNWFKTYFNFTSYIILAIYISVIGFVMIEFTDEEIEKDEKYLP